MRADKILDWLFFFSLALLIVALPLSKYLMSIAEFMLTGVFILDGIRKKEWSDFIRSNTRAGIAMKILPVGLRLVLEGIYRKFRKFFSRDNIPAIVFASLYLMHIIGLLYTVDFDYALKDLRIKFPIFLLPLIFSTTGTLSRERFKYLVLLFVASVLVSTFISTYYLLSREIHDIREVSVFISHIRFSLLICIAIFMLLYLLLKKNDFSAYHKVIIAMVLCWFVTYLVIVASITGLIILAITSVVLIVHIIFQKRRTLLLRLSILTAVIVVPAVLIYYFISIVNDVYKVYPVDTDALEEYTELGNPYVHSLSNKQVENGYYVWFYLSEKELQEAWNARSEYKYYGEDQKGQKIKYTIIRYMTSKGLHKDAAGVSQLTDEDIQRIESGEASVVYHENPVLYVRVYKIIWEYQRYQTTRNPSGHSVMQRFEYWRTALGIISDHWMTGVGTGDLNQAFDDQYESMNTLLEEKFRWRSHNQFLAIIVGFGMLGLVWFLISLLYPPIVLYRFSDYYYLTFFVIIITSMISEDTIESQAGVTIFAFFSAFYLFLKNFRDPV